jgi:hypothetical protein
MCLCIEEKTYPRKFNAENILKSEEKDKIISYCELYVHKVLIN